VVVWVRVSRSYCPQLQQFMANGGSLADPNLPLTVPVNAAGMPVCTSDCRSYFEEFYVRIHSRDEVILFVVLWPLPLVCCTRPSG
jgi:hypothetical protein